MSVTSRGRVPAKSISTGDATVISKLRAKGANILGKTGGPEPTLRARFGSHGSKHEIHECQSAYVPCEDPSITSTGNAVAASAGSAAATLDRDSHESCIIPAGRNALFAIRPTRGFISCKGTIGGEDTYCRADG